MEKTELEKIINTLTESHFRNLIEAYLKQKFKTPHVRITDGPYDGGNDLEIERDGQTIKRSIQVTVQNAGYEGKLKQDLDNVKENIEKRGYTSQFDFYISKSIGKETREQHEVNAELDGVNLKIWDARLLTEEAKNYSAIRKYAYKGHGIKTDQELVKTDQNTKILFDVLTLNQDTVEIRKNMISSLLFIYLIDHPGAELENIYTSLNKTLENSLDRNYLFQQINYLKSQNIIVSPPENKKVFNLSEEQTQRISNIKAETELQEYQLKELLAAFIGEHQIETTPEELAGHLKALYQQNYQIEIEEVTSKANSFDNTLKKSHNDLVRFFVTKGMEEDKAEAATRNLLTRCDENDYLVKLGATLLFTNLYGSEQLEQWVGNKTHRVVLDTQILIRLLVVLYDEDLEFKDTALRSIQALWEAFEKANVELVTAHGYIKEVAAHMLEATKLERFLALPYFEEFGPSKNVFFNAYQTFRERGLIDEHLSLTEFFEQLLGEEDNVPHYQDNRFISIVTPFIQAIFEGLEIHTIPYQEYDLFEDVRRSYETTLAFTHRERSLSALRHDLYTIMFLTDESSHLDERGQFNEPFLVTWDGAFYDFRKDLFKPANPLSNKLSYWYIYSPLKLVDRLAVFNFRVDPKAINANIISLVEENFKYSSKNASFLDVINSIFRKEDLGKIPLINHFKQLRKSTQSLEVDKASQYEEETQLAEVMLSLRDHYTNPEHTYQLEDLSETMEATEAEGQIIQLLKEGLEIYANPRKRKLLNKVWVKFDDLIKSGREGNG